jgi:hypothetical protein
MRNRLLLPMKKRRVQIEPRELHHFFSLRPVKRGRQFHLVVDGDAATGEPPKVH